MFEATGQLKDINNLNMLVTIEITTPFAGMFQFSLAFKALEVFYFSLYLSTANYIEEFLSNTLVDFFLDQQDEVLRLNLNEALVHAQKSIDQFSDKVSSEYALSKEGRQRVRVTLTFVEEDSGDDGDYGDYGEVTYY